MCSFTLYGCVMPWVKTLFQSSTNGLSLEKFTVHQDSFVFGLRFRLIPTFGRSTIRRFVNNVSEMKKLAARDFEDILQVCSVYLWTHFLSYLMVYFSAHPLASKDFSLQNLRVLTLLCKTCLHRWQPGMHMQNCAFTLN